MAKVSGLGYPTVTLDNSAGAGKNISNDINSITVNTSRGSTEITGLDKSAVERLLLLADAKVSMSGTFNSAADMSHAVLCTSTSSDATRTLALGYPGPATLSLEVVIESYNVERGDDGKLGWTAEMSLCNGTVPTWA